ncbi:early nodulin-like protein 1 isoform X2 [Lycium ferocissimum]|uniref:early nodulin-like protein 1 isoform X2 n=1 Tax=Lycium ferocissimum TaxID=112874 RepID=UPI002814D257|nr:early nodulin-like protein 1 isoform X2 [Lycium ferocissimum]
MALQKHLLVILLVCLISSCYAYQFYVGGKAGWVPNPSENYNHWAERMRFQVNDTLVFKYKKGSNSALVVNKDDYDKCNTNNPIKKMDDGNSIFKFDQSGLFYFISGNKDDCEKGSQKLIVLVLAIRPPPPPPPSPTPPPSTPGKSPATSPVVSPATSPVSQTPSSLPVNSPSPMVSPAISPMVSPATSKNSAVKAFTTTLLVSIILTIFISA